MSALVVVVGLAFDGEAPQAQIGKGSSTGPEQLGDAQGIPSGTSPPLPGTVSWGFEEGLLGWQKSGTAFNAQPVLGDNVTADRAVAGRLLAMPLGGTYWKKTAYPIGYRGQKWVGTSDIRKSEADAIGSRQDTALVGTLISAPFTAAKRYVTFLVGGGRDAAKLRVELLVEDPSGAVALADGAYSVVAGTPRTGMDNDALRREWWDVGTHAGKRCRVRIADEASGTWGYINVDDFTFTDTDPKAAKAQLGPVSVAAVLPHKFVSSDASTQGYIDWDAPIWGTIDMHSHPAAHLGFGGKLLHGEPDGPIGEALSSCKCSHRFWEPNNTCGNVLRGVLVNQMEEHYPHKRAPWNLPLSEPGLDHPDAGYPDFATWPSFSSATHQQMWYGWIRRAYEGGLRVLVALSVNNSLLAMATDGDPPNDDRTVADAQIAYTKEFVANHSDFMEIAYTPAGLRDIVRRNKLAVVLGTEMDAPGDLYRSLLPAANILTKSVVEGELERQYCEGVRYQFLVHLVDNAFSGAAVYNDMFNVSNKFYSLLPAVVDNPVPSGKVFEVEAASDPLVDFRLRAPLSLDSTVVGGIRLGVKHLEMDPFMKMILNSQGEYKVLKAYFLTPDPRLDAYASLAPGKGHQNKKGLTDLGVFALRELMDIGTMIDIDHMSQKALQSAGPSDGVLDAFEIAKERDVPYPLNSGHNGFRVVGSKIWQTVNENNRTDAMYKEIVKLGGLIGLGNGYQPQLEDHPARKVSALFSTAPTRISQTARDLEYNCGGSSQSFAMSYLYAVELGAGAAVALGTDTDGIFPKIGPRFGSQATLGNNRCAAQATASKVQYGGTDGLQKRKDGNREWDFNTDGTAHYGMLPDFFQDLRNIGLTGRDLSPLFLSAERFARMWEQSLRSSTKTISSQTCAARLAGAKKGYGESCGGDDDCLNNRCDKGTFTTNTNKCIPNDGTGAVGEYCTNSAHCKNNNCDLGVKKCKARADVGAACQSNTDCISNRCDAGLGTTGHLKCTCSGPDCVAGVYCTHDNQCKGYCTATGGGEGTCKNKVSLGAYCERNTMCGSGACDLAVKKCVPLNGTGKNGEYCTNTGQCSSSSYCPSSAGSTCRAREGIGGSCSGSPGWCKPGLGCDSNKKCFAAGNQAKDGEYCSNTNQCSTSSFCPSPPSTCKRRRLVPHNSYGSDADYKCDGNDNCLSNFCNAPVNNRCYPAQNTGSPGDFCVNNANCLAGHACMLESGKNWGFCN